MKTNIKYIYAITFLLLFQGLTQAQSTVKDITRQDLIWFTHAQSFELSPKWTAIAEFTERRFTNPFTLHSRATRLRIHYHIGQWRIGGGMAFFLQRSNDPYSTSEFLYPELRPHLECTYQNVHGKLTISHRYRAEKRFFRNTENEQLIPGYTSNYRFRYRLGFDYLLLKNKRERSLTLKISDEIHLNAGETVKYNTFDQNRIYIGLQYALPANFAIEVGYINWFQQRASGNQYFARDILSINLSHKITFK